MLFRVFVCVFVLLESVIAKKIIVVHVFVVFFQYQIDFTKPIVLHMNFPKCVIVNLC